MKTLIVGFILLMAPVLSQALTPQQYCESIEAKSSNSIEILNVDGGQIKMCYKGRFCVGQSVIDDLGRGDHIQISEIVVAVDEALRGRNIVDSNGSYEDGGFSGGWRSRRIVPGRSPFFRVANKTRIYCN